MNSFEVKCAYSYDSESNIRLKISLQNLLNNDKTIVSFWVSLLVLAKVVGLQEAAKDKENINSQNSGINRLKKPCIAVDKIELYVIDRSQRVIVDVT
jgi:hypothetical protein